MREKYYIITDKNGGDSALIARASRTRPPRRNHGQLIAHAMQLKRLAPTYTWQTGSRTIFQDIVSGSRYLFYAPVVVVVAVSLRSD